MSELKMAALDPDTQLRADLRTLRNSIVANQKQIAQLERQLATARQQTELQERLYNALEQAYPEVAAALDTADDASPDSIER